MRAFTKPSKRTAVAACAAAVVLGAIGVGTAGAAFADGSPTAAPSSSSAPTAGPAERAPGGPAADGTAATPPRHEPRIGGEVLSVSGSTVTVRDPEGFTRTIRLGDDVTVTKDGAASDVAAVVQGEHIDATGQVASDGTTLDATAVTVGRPTPPAGRDAGAGEGGPGHGMRGGPGEQQPGAGGAPASPAPSASEPSGQPSVAPTSGS
jgi:hypothetical protein